jgi:hypothetical protein
VFDCQKQGGERAVRMTDDDDFAEMEHLNECRKVLRITMAEYPELAGLIFG